MTDPWVPTTDGGEGAADRPSPRKALERAAQEQSVILPAGLLLDVLRLEEVADPQGSARERQAKLQALIEQATRDQ